MRIVYIEDFFHPEAGYSINLLSKYWALFGNDVIILSAEAENTPASLTSFFDYNDLEEKDHLFEEKYKVKIIRLPIRRVVSGRAVFKRSIFQKIKELNPDIVYCNGNDSLIGMQLTLRARRADYGLVMDSHMLEIASKNRYRKIYQLIYKTVFARIIKKNHIPIIRTQDNDYIEKCLGIPLKTSPFISFGSDTSIFHPDENERKIFREKHGISEETFVIIYAGKLNTDKGIDILHDLLKTNIQTTKKVLFLIVGKLDSSIDDQEHYFDDCCNSIMRFPTQKYPDLPKFYQASDLAVFPKQCSLSFFDVQACGLPVVFEDNPVNLKRIAGENAVVYSAGNVEEFKKKIETFIEMDIDKYKEYKENAVTYIKENYDYEDRAREYFDILIQQQKIRNSI